MPYLISAIKLASQIPVEHEKLVVEYGCGMYSTPIIMAMCGRDRMVSFEHEASWASQVNRVVGPVVNIVESWPVVENAGVVFMDNGPKCDDRYPIIQRYLEMPIEYQPWLIVVHDYPSRYNKKYRDGVMNQFEFRKYFNSFLPRTCVVSNRFYFGDFGFPTRELE